jgi:2-methylisocitrate lyase-like PEP mutase family enzyme
MDRAALAQEAAMALTQREKAEQFRAMHAAPRTFVIPNPWDIGTARILTALGFQALATTSAGYAFTIGRKDGAITREDALTHARAIVEATDLPVSADLENCFGDAPENVAETLRLAAATGLAGGSVEDASGDPHRPIYDFSHAVERVAAAVEAVRALPIPFTLTARAENFLHGRPDLDDTIRRLQAFEAAGADVLYAPGLRDMTAVRAVCGAVSKPINVIALRGLTVPELAAAGVRRISLGSALSRVALGAFHRAVREIQTAGTFDFIGDAMSSAEANAFMLGRD